MSNNIQINAATDLNKPVDEQFRAPNDKIVHSESMTFREEISSFAWASDSPEFNSIKAAKSPVVYAKTLESSLRIGLNGIKSDVESVNSVFPVKFLPNRTDVPTPIVRHLFNDRGAVVATNGDWSKPKKAVAMAGSEIFVEPANKAILLSYSIPLYDFKVESGFTHATLIGDMNNIVDNILKDINAKVASQLADSKLVRKVDGGKLEGKLFDKGQDVLDAITQATDSALGANVEDYGLVIHEDLVKALASVARRSGFGGEDGIEEMLGTDFCSYNGEDKGVFLMPKAFTGLSFAPPKVDGEWFTTILTRDTDRQAFVLEVIGKLYILNEATTEIKDGIRKDAAVLPVVTNITFTK
ncbi:hypothetical protein [Citrobacter freundii]|uniref:hypothetical protein n=1 Tax=Citrobacter freundii TaxID=546 RepID=UPI002E2F2BA0|nr:hypothetical protein [Citrobacter freundii]